jgi:hypothetical protein
MLEFAGCSKRSDLSGNRVLRGYDLSNCGFRWQRGGEKIQTESWTDLIADSHLRSAKTLVKWLNYCESWLNFEIEWVLECIMSRVPLPLRGWPKFSERLTNAEQKAVFGGSGDLWRDWAQQAQAFANHGC